MTAPAGRRWWVACAAAFALALAATAPTAGDIGLTWDEPVYRQSQVLSARWWEQVGRARSWPELGALLDADTLAYHWPYGRFGINFHPPLAGQASALTHATFGRWMKDVPARRMASVLEYALTIAILFGFLAARYGPWVGGVAAGSLLLMPRVYGDGHIAGTDTPGLLLWAATAVASWKGLNDPGARRWRVLVGVLLGLAFATKMGAVAVLLPIGLWLVVARLPGARRADWIDGLVTTAALLVPLGLAWLEIRRLTGLLPRPGLYDPFDHHVRSDLPGAILLAPALAWFVRRLAGRLRPDHPVWGAERPALETWTAILAFAPAVGWLGNPAWWREAMPRLAHYAMLNGDRRGALPDIRIFYLGQTYLYSLPWHNAWVLIAVTVPAGILAAALVGVAYGLRHAGRDRLPLYFLVHLATLPVLRMLPTPAHDGVRLILPAFFFLAAFAGWGVIGAADVACRRPSPWCRGVLAALVLGSAAGQLARIHPFELSYYNELIGGPSGAWRRGFELSYWYDAFNPRTLAELEARLPGGAAVGFPNEHSQPPTFAELQALGALRGDLDLNPTGLGPFPFKWLLTHDSKANAFTRLLFAMTPWYERRPRQLDGLRVATVADPVAVSRAWALQLLADAPGPPLAPARAPLPRWLRRVAPGLGRFWGEGLTRPAPPGVDPGMLDWARTDPAGLRAAARTIAAGSPPDDPASRRLMDRLARYDRPEVRPSAILLRHRPEALVEAVEILIRRPDAVRSVLLRPGYTDPEAVGGYLDRDLPAEGRGASPSSASSRP